MWITWLQRKKHYIHHQTTTTTTIVIIQYCMAMAKFPPGLSCYCSLLLCLQTIRYFIPHIVSTSRFSFIFLLLCSWFRSIFKLGTESKKPIELCVDSAPPTECGNMGCTFDPKNLIELLTTFCNLEMYRPGRWC